MSSASVICRFHISRKSVWTSRPSCSCDALSARPRPKLVVMFRCFSAFVLALNRGPCANWRSTGYYWLLVQVTKQSLFRKFDHRQVGSRNDHQEDKEHRWKGYEA